MDMGGLRAAGHAAQCSRFFFAVKPPTASSSTTACELGAFSTGVVFVANGLGAISSGPVAALRLVVADFPVMIVGFALATGLGAFSVRILVATGLGAAAAKVAAGIQVTARTLDDLLRPLLSGFLEYL